MYGSEECGGSFAVTRFYCSVMLEFFEEILDRVAGLVDRSVIVARLLSVGFRGNDRPYFHGIQPVEHPFIGIIALVGDQGSGLDFVDQHICAIKIAGLSGRQMKAGRIAQSVAGRMDFGTQSAF